VVISDRYVRTPADFGSWDTIIDQSRQRPIQTSYSQADLQSWDPARTETGEPRILVALDVDTTDRVRYEWWPHPTAAQHYPALYKSRPQALADSFTFRGVLGDRQDVLVAGALVRASQWPGTEQHRNPYFVLGLNQQLKADWQQAIHSLGLRDDDQSVRSYSTIPWHEYHQGGAFSTEQLRSSDATLDDYL